MKAEALRSLLTTRRRISWVSTKFGIDSALPVTTSAELETLSRHHSDWLTATADTRLDRCALVNSSAS